jgi:site-specific recombinase XerD
MERAADYAAAEKSDVTRRAYKSDFNHFRSWCEALGCTAPPASVGTVAAYLASLADVGLKASMITRTMQSLRHDGLAAQWDRATAC